MIVQRADDRRAPARRTAGTIGDAALDAAATREGWAAAMRLIRRLGANARYFTDQSTQDPARRRDGRRGGRHVHRLLRALPGRGRGRGGPARARRIRHRRAARPRSTPIRSPCCAAPRTASSRSRSSSSCCPTRARSCGASGVACPAARSATRCAGCRSCPICTTTRSTRLAPTPTRTPTRRRATSSITAPGPGRCTARSRSSCASCASTPEDGAAGGVRALWRKPAFPPQATALFDDVSAVDYATVAGPLRAALQVGRSARGGALVASGWSTVPRAIPARDRAGAGGQLRQREAMNARRDASSRPPSCWSARCWPCCCSGRSAESVRGAFVVSRRRAHLRVRRDRVFHNPIYREGLRNALAIAVFSTGDRGRVRHRVPRCCSHRYQFPGRRLLAALVPLPLMVPPFVGAIGIEAAARAAPAR